MNILCRDNYEFFLIFCLKPNISLRAKICGWTHKVGAAITQLAAISFHVGELLSGNWLMPLPGQLSLLSVNYQGTGGREVKN